MESELKERSLKLMAAGVEASEALARVRSAMEAEATGAVDDRTRNSVHTLYVEALHNADALGFDRQGLRFGERKHSDDKQRWPMRLSNPLIDGRVYCFDLTPDECAEVSDNGIMLTDYRFAARVMAARRTRKVSRKSRKPKVAPMEAMPQARVLTDVERLAMRTGMKSDHIREDN